MDSVVFLDVDGVLHPAQAPGADAADGAVLFPADTLALLRGVCAATSPPASVVLTSNWRKSPQTTARVDSELRAAGIVTGVSSSTDWGSAAPSARGAEDIRREEICRWLRNYSPSHFVVLDDLPLGSTAAGGPPSQVWGRGVYSSMSQHCVCTDYSVGLDAAGAELAAQMLKDDALRWQGESLDDEDDDEEEILASEPEPQSAAAADAEEARQSRLEQQQRLTFTVRHGKAVHTLALPHFCTVGDLRAPLKDLCGIDPDLQTLVLRDTVLEDDDAELGAAGITEGCKLMLVGSERGVVDRLKSSDLAAACKAAGNEALQAGKLDEAIANYTEAVALSPDDHIFLANRSAAFAKRALEGADNASTSQADFRAAAADAQASCHNNLQSAETRDS